MRSSGKSSIISEVRKCLGLSQAEFANYLKVERGHLSMAELGKRELPPQIRLHLVQLFNTIHEATKNRGKVPEDKDHKIKSKILEEAKYKVALNERKVKKLEKALSNLQSDHTWATIFLATFDALLVNASPKTVALLNMQRDKAEALIEKTGENIRLNVELRIEAMKGELAFLKKKLKRDDSHE